MSAVHQHDGRPFHTHTDEEYAAHEQMTDEVMDPAATPEYDGHQDAPVIGREDVPGPVGALPPETSGGNALAEQEAAAQTTAAAETLAADQEKGYHGEDAADRHGDEELREHFGGAKDGPGAPTYPPGHPNDPTVPPSAGTAGPKSG